jgi:hypothetical protein
LLTLKIRNAKIFSKKNLSKNLVFEKNTLENGKHKKSVWVV